jgi:PAS domain S-box-containing protein
VIRRPWAAYLVCGTAASTAYLVVSHFLHLGPVFNLIGLSAPLAVLVGVRRHRPASGRAWRMFALGLTLFVAGDVITYNYQALFHRPLPFPSVGDALYLAVYPCLILGFLSLVRGRNPGRDTVALIDSLIITIGLGLVSWITLMAPYAHDPTLSLGSKLVSIAYPLMDLMVLAVAVRLFVGSGRRSPALTLLFVAVVSLFVTDSVYGWYLLHGGYEPGSLLDGGWLLFYLLCGAAALHPTIRALDQPARRSEPRRPRLRLVLLAGAALLSPGVNVYQSTRGQLIDPGIVSLFSATLFVLVILRMGQLMVDVSRYRTAEARIRAAEAKYRNLVEKLPAIVYIAEFGVEGRWLYVSPQVQGILGFTPEEWMADPAVWQESIDPEDRPRVLDEELAVLRSGARLDTQYRIRARDGRVVWIREEADAVLGDDGRPELLQGIMFDISEQKLAELTLQRALAKEKEAADELRALDELKNSFLQAVSHDLRTPLTTILGNAITLGHGEVELSEDDARDLLSRIESNARRLHRLLTDLLDVDRLSRGMVEPRHEWIDVPELVERVVAECSLDTRSVHWESEPVAAMIDPAQVERIVENLVVNAIRHTPDGTPVWVRVSAPSDALLLTVEDAGPGVPAGLREAVFEPFRRGPDATSTGQGVGIGLSLVARFAALEGGRAWVEDRAGGGASFRVLLPVRIRPLTPEVTGQKQSA